MPIRFRFRWIPFIAAIIAAAVGIALGNWQTRRAHEKEAIEARLTKRESAPPVSIGGVTLAPEELEYRRVVVRGEFVPGWTVYLDNRPYEGMAGFYVLAPLKIADTGRYVLVARGWIRRDPLDRAKLPPIRTPAGVVELQGIGVRGPGHVLQLGAPELLRPSAIVQNLSVGEFAQASQLPMQPFVIEQLSDTQDGLVRDWPRPSLGVEKHRGYAFQWYALAATALIFFVVTGFRRGRE
ncbi:MAG TPA: SURF1 family protein [Noviherbaspirillum sp.]|uniref:SURF1 family protein n=1 Tax=Noviherbaspirillum sp. TaxID=1926288 RepID=UPI002B48FDFB|nr:SURF1 family protein [Noviherbaspirillum sp.]HJV87950.1 SURF1 family protein [Noviherbaspirillum sp.]